MAIGIKPIKCDVFPAVVFGDYDKPVGIFRIAPNKVLDKYAAKLAESMRKTMELKIAQMNMWKELAK